MTTPHPQLITAFNVKARWNLFGSVVYESLRIGHNAVLATLFAPQDFGFVGALFASTYLVVRISDAGATNALLPFFGYLEHSRATFKSFFVRKLFLSLFITAPIGAGLATIFLQYSQYRALTPLAIVLPPLIISETLRSFLRQFLHLAGKSKQTLVIDHLTFALYVCVCWPLLWYFPCLRTPVVVFTLFLADSILGLINLMRLAQQYGQSLPEYEDAPPQPSTYSLYSSRLYAWAMRICKEALSSNALTPLFAATVGLKQAGLFYFAATVAMAVHAIMRSVIGYAGASFFISAKKAALSTADAFKLVTRTLSRIIFVLVLFFALTLQDILSLAHVTAASSLLMLFFVLYFAIIFLEFTLFLYEQQYQFEQAGAQALLWRLFELSLVYIAARGQFIADPTYILMCIILAKSVTLIALAITGYRRWAIRPSLRIAPRTLLQLGGVSLGLALLFKIIIHYGLNLI